MPPPRQPKAIALPPRETRRGRDGFTLIEVLAAFVILALFTVAIQRNVVAAAWTMSRAETRLGAETVAATLLDGPLTGANGAPGPAAGTMNGYDWTLRLEPLPPERFGAGGAATGEAPGWTPVRVTVTVAGAGSRQTIASAQTVRLVRAAPP